jgi:hypothetical protein
MLPMISETQTPACRGSSTSWDRPVITWTRLASPARRTARSACAVTVAWASTAYTCRAPARAAVMAHNASRPVPMSSTTRPGLATRSACRYAALRWLATMNPS